jgi:hypothetical protein
MVNILCILVVVILSFILPMIFGRIIGGNKTFQKDGK